MADTAALAGSERFRVADAGLCDSDCVWRDLPRRQVVHEGTRGRWARWRHTHYRDFVERLGLVLVG